MHPRPFPTIAKIAAGLTLSASLLQAGAAQASTFYDFNFEWSDNTTITGWFELDDTPEIDDIDDYFYYNRKSWASISILDANFTYQGITYGESDVAQISLTQYTAPPDNPLSPWTGKVLNMLYGSLLDDVFLNIADFGAGENPLLYTDVGYKLDPVSQQYAIARSISLAERTTPSTAVPEPTTLLGIAFIGVAMTANRRKPQGK